LDNAPKLERKADPPKEKKKKADVAEQAASGSQPAADGKVKKEKVAAAPVEGAASAGDGKPQ
jgi:aminoacyl tRNA synthase complex-interacting multifunctional protein 1